MISGTRLDSDERFALLRICWKSWAAGNRKMFQRSIMGMGADLTLQASRAQDDHSD